MSILQLKLSLDKCGLWHNVVFIISNILCVDSLLLVWPTMFIIVFVVELEELASCRFLWLSCTLNCSAPIFVVQNRCTYRVGISNILLRLGSCNSMCILLLSLDKVPNHHCSLCKTFWKEVHFFVYTKEIGIQLSTCCSLQCGHCYNKHIHLLKSLWYIQKWSLYFVCLACAGEALPSNIKCLNKFVGN